MNSFTSPSPKSAFFLAVAALLMVLVSVPAEAQDFNASGKPPLEGRIETQSIQLQQQSAALDPRVVDSASLEKPKLTGQAQKELTENSIEWDRWRNRLARAIWTKANEAAAGGDAVYIGPLCLKFGNAPYRQFQKGLEVVYTCEVTRDRQIINATIESPSGDQNFDQLILASVRAVNGKKLLEFPAGSERYSVKARELLRVGRHKFDEAVYGDKETVTTVSE